MLYQVIYDKLYQVISHYLVIDSYTVKEGRHKVVGLLKIFVGIGACTVQLY